MLRRLPTGYVLFCAAKRIMNRKKRWAEWRQGAGEECSAFETAAAINDIAVPGMSENSVPLFFYRPVFGKKGLFRENLKKYLRAVTLCCIMTPACIAMQATPTLEGFQSGQMEQTVNLSPMASMVRIHPPPPTVRASYNGFYPSLPSL